MDGEQLYSHHGAYQTHCCGALDSWVNEVEPVLDGSTECVRFNSAPDTASEPGCKRQASTGGFIMGTRVFWASITCPYGFWPFATTTPPQPEKHVAMLK
jgi:hypothetical protein